PEVNGYWMCDIGRFDYHWIESDKRVRRPLARAGAALEPGGWHDVLPKVSGRLAAAGTSNPEAVKFLVSAHASHEELFLFKRLSEMLIGGDARAINVSWR